MCTWTSDQKLHKAGISHFRTSQGPGINPISAPGTAWEDVPSGNFHSICFAIQIQIWSISFLGKRENLYKCSLFNTFHHLDENIKWNFFLDSFFVLTYNASFFIQEPVKQVITRPVFLFCILVNSWNDLSPNYSY